MQVGDLVRIKFATYSSMHRAKAMGNDIKSTGIVVEVAENACKVWWTNTNKINPYLRSSLEIINSL
jgi:hypothetical protein